MSFDPLRPRLMKGEKIMANRDQVFTIVEKIGVGRCAYVYHALDEKSGQNVALKVYNAGKRYEGALQRELSVFETLQSSGNQPIVQYFDHFESSGHHCIVLELLDSSMRQILYKNNKKGLKLWAVQKFAKDIFRGLALLHSEKLVHADLKPSNIHWSAQHGCFKLIDFGLSFHLSEKNVHQVQSEGYQAPEVVIWNQVKQGRRNDHSITGRPEEDYLICTDQINTDHGTGLNDESCRIQIAGALMENTGCTNHVERKNWSNSSCSLCDQCNKPGKPIDVWSIGALLMEIATGGKFVKDSSVLCKGKCIRTHCSTRDLIDSRFEDTICQQSNDLNTSAGYEVLRDLIYRCCCCDARTRVTSDSALNHPFCQLNLEPASGDGLLLPTPVILATNFMDEDELDGMKLYSDVTQKLIHKCLQYGPITSSAILKTKPKASVLVMYETAQASQKAVQLLSGKRFNNKILTVSYYPIEMYKAHHSKNTV